MYAVIKASGRQFKVAENQVVTLNRLEGEIGSKVEFPVLAVIDSKEPVFGSPMIPKAKVEAEIVRHYRGKKIRGFNYKPKKNERRRWGFRPELTDVKILKITAGK
ncbi:MAG TPA: 50S ribosomal protein L21 [Fimbriimonadales bacterium]|nr:50S ribosomal protein L21 [Fimbriimonadales bacterium]